MGVIWNDYITDWNSNHMGVYAGIPIRGIDIMDREGIVI